jgi:tetratricopeptide (TPR) repeat protein
MADTPPQAEQLKNDGNAHFKEGDYTQAVGCYTAALGALAEAQDAQATRSACLLNRAACWLKTSQPDRAIEDCSEVLAADGSNPKALFRRGQAWGQTNRLLEARSDLHSAVSERPPVKTDCLPLNCSGNPGVNGVSDWGNAWARPSWRRRTRPSARPTRR